MCFRSFFSLTLLSLLTVSCADLGIHRSYMDQMSAEESAFYTPNDDFPIAAGDSGRSWYTDEELLERVPRSEEELAELRQQQHIREELASLEASLDEDEAKLYRKYKSKLSTPSERIFFLKLPYEDQRTYLAARGLYETERSPASVTPSDYFGLRQEAVALGMTKDQVMNNFGRPSRVEVAGNPRFENERWLYVGNGASKYIYFEGGIVQGWE